MRADHADEARAAPREAAHLLDPAFGDRLVGHAGDGGEAFLEELFQFRAGEEAQGMVDLDLGAHLVVFGIGHDLAQVLVRDQHELQAHDAPVLQRVEPRQLGQHLEHVRLEVVRLVDEDHARLAALCLHVQELAQGDRLVRRIEDLVFDAQGRMEEIDEFAEVEAGILQEERRRLLRQSFGDGPHDHGLARPRGTGQDHHARPFAHPLQHPVDRAPMRGIEVERAARLDLERIVAGIRCRHAYRLRLSGRAIPGPGAPQRIDLDEQGRETPFGAPSVLMSRGG